MIPFRISIRDINYEQTTSSPIANEKVMSTTYEGRHFCTRSPYITNINSRRITNNPKG